MRILQGFMILFAIISAFGAIAESMSDRKESCRRMMLMTVIFSLLTIAIQMQ